MPDEEARLELNFVDTHGEPLPAMLAITYLRHGINMEPAHSLVVTDVSELIQMQHQLKQRAAELEELNEELLMHDRAKDSFLSNVSHELRTPLSTIQGYVEMLDSGSLGALESAQHSAIRVMDRNVRRLVGHLNETIESSRMEIRGVDIPPPDEPGISGERDGVVVSSGGAGARDHAGGGSGGKPAADLVRPPEDGPGVGHPL